MIKATEIEYIGDGEYLKLTLEDSAGIEIGHQFQDDIFGAKLYVHKIDGNNVYCSQDSLISSCIIKNTTH